MSDHTLMTEFPVLSIVTNFEKNGDFERVYLVVAPKQKPVPKSNRKTKTSFLLNNTWNGPLLQHHK